MASVTLELDDSIYMTLVSVCEANGMSIGDYIKEALLFFWGYGGADEDEPTELPADWE